MYAAVDALRAVRFDAVKLEVVGDSVVVVESIRTSSSTAEFSVSRHGGLAYVPGSRAAGAVRSLVWVDRDGREEPIAAPPRGYQMPRVSPDGSRVAISINDEDQDIWIWDLARRTLTRLTVAPGQDWYHVWTPDSKRIIYGSERDGIGHNALFWQAADNTGTVERLTAGPERSGAASISPDGTRLITMRSLPKTGWDLHVLPLPPFGEESKSTTQLLVQTPAAELFGELSPDGHWLAYQSDESGQNQIWVRPFPNVACGQWQISTSGGITPVWARNGKELFYLDLTNAVTSVPIQTTPTFSAGAPQKLFAGRYAASAFWRTYDVAPDGRFLMIKENASGDQPTAPATIVVVLNWFEELKARLPSTR